MITLAGKRILVTGAGGGIGLAIAETLATAGATIMVNDLEVRPAEEAAHLIGRGAVAVPGDVSTPEGCVAVTASALDDDRLDGLVNNAGMAQTVRRIADQSPLDWQRVMDVNVRGPWLMSRAAAPALSRAAGTIVNISSVAGLVGFPASHAYGVSKAALVMLTQTLATELARDGVRVNAVAPGVIDAPMLRHVATDARKRAATVARVPLGRLGEPREVGNAVAFLCSGLASYVTGAVLPVDGGWLAFGGVGAASFPKESSCS